MWANEPMMREAYERLSDVVCLIRFRIAEVWKEPDAFAGSWSSWAEAFVSGLYVERMARQVIENAPQDASRLPNPERRFLARAAVLAVDAAREGMWGDPTRTIVILAEARRLAEQSSAQPFVSAWTAIGKDVQLRLRLHPDGWGWHSWERRPQNGGGATGKMLAEPADDLRARRFATRSRAERFFAYVVNDAGEW